MRRVHVGAADVVREEETPGRHVFGIATEEALVTDQVCRYLLRDLLDDEFSTQGTVSVGWVCAVRVQPGRVQSDQRTRIRKQGQLRFERGRRSDLPVNETDLIVVGRVHVQGSGNHGLEGSIQLDPGVVAHRRVAGEML